MALKHTSLRRASRVRSKLSVEEVGADRYSIGEDGSVLTQGDFLTGAKIKRQSRSPAAEITF